MVWGAFSSLGRLDLHFTMPRMDSIEYIQVLEQRLVSYLKRFRIIKLIYQQYGAAIHRSKATSDWFESKRIETLPWPARSPDCNPMENIWAILARRVYANNKQYDTVEELKIAILAACNTIDMSLLKKLSDSMNNRLYDVIEKKEGVINY